MSLKNRFSLFSFSEGSLTSTSDIVERLSKYPYKNLGRTNKLNTPISFCGADEIVDEQNFHSTANRILFSAIFQNRVINKSLVKKELDRKIEVDFPHILGVKSGEEYQFLKDEVINELSERFLVKTNIVQVGVSFKNNLLYVFAGESESLTVAKKIADILDLKNVKLMTLVSHVHTEGTDLREDFQVVMATLLLRSLVSQSVLLDEVSLTQDEASFKVSGNEVRDIPGIIIDEKTLTIDSLLVKLKEGNVDGHWVARLDRNSPGKFWLNPKFSSRNTDAIVDFIEYDEGVTRLISECKVAKNSEKTMSEIKETAIREIMRLEFRECD